MSRNELQAGVEYVRSVLTHLHNEAETRALSDEEWTQVDDGLRYVNDSETTLARYEALERAAAQPANVERTETAPSFNVNRERTADEVYDLTRAAGPAGSEAYGRDVRDRAVRSLDHWDSSFTPEMRENAERVILRADREQYPGQVAAHILRTGNPHYMTAFKKIVANPQAAAFSLSEPERAAVAEVTRAALNEGTTTQGGYLVPPMLDPNIILTNNGTVNPFRQIATVKTIATQTWKGVTSAGVTAEWTAEAAEVADASPTFAQPSITPVRADAYMQASIEMVQDTDITSEVAMLIADAKDRLESTAFAVGTGSTQPYGIVTELQLVTASRVAGSSGAAGAADLVIGDIYALDNALPPRHRMNANWLADKSTYNKIRRFGEGSNGSNSAFWTDLGHGLPPELIGYPAYQSSEMDSAIVSGSNDDCLILGDFKKYYIVDRIGLELVYNPLVLGSNRRPTGEVGWVAFWRVGGRTVDANAFRMLRI